MRTLALALLAFALAAIAIVHYAAQRTVAIQGPGVLQVIDAQTVWLGVNTDLWILDAQGHRKSRKTATELGLQGSVSNIALAPAGQALLTSRKDLAWQVVNTTDLSRVRTIVPLDFTRFRRHKSTSGLKLLERKRTHLVKMTVPADSIVKTLNVVKHV